MSVVPSLLQAIVHVDGEAMVIHVGEKPYVVAPSGQVELASRGLTLEAASGILNQLLPTAQQQALDEFGAVQYDLPQHAEFPNERFTVVAARGGDDIWVEIRRRCVLDDDNVPEELFGSSPSQPAEAPAPVAAAPLPVQAPVAPKAPPPPAPAAVASSAAVSESGLDEAITIDDEPGDIQLVGDEDLMLPDETQLWPGGTSGAADLEVVDEDLESVIDEDEPIEIEYSPPPVITPASQVRETPAPPIVAPPPPPPVQPAATVQAAPPPIPKPAAPPARPAPAPAVVLPMSRNPVRTDVAPPAARSDETLSGLERLLRTAAARGASTLYVSSDERPSVRVDGAMQSLDGEPVLASNDVVSLLLTLMPERSHEALRTGATTEWITDIEDIGRVRCMSFSDHRGPGGVFRLMPVRAVSVDQLGLSREIQGLAIEPEGLVLIAGPRSSGKRTLISALVDLINRTRRDHVITIEREVNIVHARGNSLVSQREVRGTDEEVLAAARAALREDPDVLMLEQIRTGALMNVAIEAVASGRLVIGGFAAHNATEAIDRIIDLYAPEYSRQVQLALADNLRGVIVQVLLPKIGGGRVAAREVLLNSPAVASVIAEGKTSQLPMAIEGGRRHGMLPLHDGLLGYVQSGAVDVREAYRHVSDRAAFLALLKRQGIDTSPIERLA